ncbi:MAG: hypothetical protein HYU86_09410 [Chloroflexi bacterium]|nr:hypothetical protein [Chloroflexota bacterium]
MDKRGRDELRHTFGMAEGDIARVSPRIVAALPRLPAWQRCRIVAQVTESQYCLGGLEAGHRFVFDGGMLNTAESTAPLCLRALAPLAWYVELAFDRIMDGRDPNAILISTAQCMDPGLEGGGVGNVKFRLYAQEVP